MQHDTVDQSRLPSIHVMPDLYSSKPRLHQLHHRHFLLVTFKVSSWMTELLAFLHFPHSVQAVIVLRLWLEGESRPSTCCLYSPLHHRWGQQSIDKYSNAFHQMATSKKQIASKYSEADTRLMLIRGALPPLLTTKESTPWPNQI